MKFKFIAKEGISKLPKNAGVYIFKDETEILYIGKSSNIRERVRSHFRQPGYKDSLFLDKIKKVGYIKTGSEIEALISEANLIKKYQPKYNVIWRDDKNYFFVGITKEDFPRIFLTHQPAKIFSPKKLRRASQKPISNFQFTIYNFVGPFVDGKALKQALKILRKVFPYRSCKTLPNRPCLWYHLGRCPAPCLIRTPKENLRFPTGQAKLAKQIPMVIDRMKRDCQENAENVFKIFQGKKNQVLKNLKKEMKEASKTQDFEKAAKLRDQSEALERILENTKIFSPEKTTVESRSWQYLTVVWRKVEKELKEILRSNRGVSRIEAYDVSNIQGKLATGAMVTFIKGKPEKNFYRRFKITGKFTPYRTEGSGAGPNDIAMLKETLKRRLNHPEWGMPDLILIDGGIAQLNAALKCKMQNAKCKMIKVMALAKRKNELFIEGQKNPILLKTLPREIFNLILQLRDEAHRFAISYHKKLREKDLFGGC
jgi:excinuclease ABC subunit C